MCVTSGPGFLRGGCAFSTHFFWMDADNSEGSQEKGKVKRQRGPGFLIYPVEESLFLPRKIDLGLIDEQQ